ncbi:hypothetical protein DERF_003362 [Dermatophagoides farinae]|uniref:Uncharacterized protein n=1 Tax=Dermatophagoides farinae TaxID=6954 RepID=A0A922LBF8_DERFA|nr:hypothetical protein DERF_003362 [Dermatophagoides farinae]
MFMLNLFIIPEMCFLRCNVSVLLNHNDDNNDYDMNEQNKIIRINWQKVVFVHLYNGAELND